MIRLKIIILLSLIFVQTSFPQQKKDYKDITDSEKALFYFIEGKTYELQNNFIGAIENYREALKYDKSAGIYAALADVYFRLSKLDEALQQINSALKLSPDNQTYLETLANIYIAKKNFVKAAEVFERIIASDSNYVYGLYTLARLYQEMNLPAKAIPIYEMITNKIGFDFDVLNKLYDLYISNKDFKNAAIVLEDILEIDPFNYEVKKLLASFYLGENRIAEARELYEEVFTLNPTDKSVQTELVKIYFKQNESDKAYENFSKMLGKDSLGFIEKVQVGELYFNLISQDASAKGIAKNVFTNLNNDYPDEWIPYYYIGAINLIDKETDSYKKNFDRAIELADTSREAYINVGFTYFQQGEAEEALRVLDIGLNKNPDDYRLNYIKGLSLQRLNREPEAIVFFENAVNSNSGDVGILSTLALAYDTQGKYEKSSETYEKALALDPQNALVLNNYAYNLSERDMQLERALAMSKIAVEKEPGNSSYLDTMGWIYYKLRNYKNARKYIEKSLAVNPNSAVVLEHLGDVCNAMKDYPSALKYWKLSYEKNPDNKSVKEKIESLRIS